MADAISVKFTAKDQFTRISEKMNKALAKNRKAFRGLDDQMQKSARRARKSSNEMTKGFSRMGKALAGVATVAAGLRVGKAGFENALTLDQQIARSLQNVRGKDQRAKMRPLIKQAILDGSAISGKGRDEVGSGLFAQLSAQGATPEALKNFTDNLKLATASTADLTTVVEGVSKVQANFADARGPGGAARVGAAVFAAQSVGITDVGKILENIPGISGTLGASGVSSTDAIALLSGATTKLKGTAESATAVGDLYSTLLTARPGTPQYGAIKGLGLPAGAEELSRANPVALLEKIGKSARENERMFNEVFTTIPAQQLARAVDPELLGKIQTIQQSAAFDIANPDQSAVTVNFAEATAGLMGAQIDNTKALNEAKDAVGNQLAPAMTGLTDAFNIIALRNEAKGGGIGGLIGETIKEGAGATARGIFGETDDFRERREAERVQLRVEVDARGLSQVTSGSTGDQTVTD